MKMLFDDERVLAKLKFANADSFNDVPCPVGHRAHAVRMHVLDSPHGTSGADSDNYLTCRFGSSKTF